MATEEKKFIEIDPEYPLAYENRGISNYDLKEYDRAIADYTKAIELRSSYVDAYLKTRET